MSDESAPSPELRRGWTTGACATAAARAALDLLLGSDATDPVDIRLPNGARTTFALAMHERGQDFARAGVVKDAGDDPDVTHGALVIATVRPSLPGSGLTFRAGAGVGTVTRPGLPIAVGEPAINPVPRQMIGWAVDEVCGPRGLAPDFEVEIGIADGEALALKTLNPRLGIVGGLSVLGTTGIVIPFSCAAWIHSIHRGIDVARAMGLDHVAGATGSTSEAAVQKLHELDEIALIDMGDFAGGMLKYIAKHPVRRVTVACGFAKGVKLAQGLLDLHSKRGTLDLAALAAHTRAAGADSATIAAIEAANSALHALEIASAARIDLPASIARAGWVTAAGPLKGTGIELEIALFDRAGGLLATTGFRDV